MKLKCNHDRRAMVLPSGNTIHRSDGSQCAGSLKMGDSKVTKLIKDKDVTDFILAVLNPAP